MILTMENLSTQQKTFPSVIFSATYPMWSGLESNPELHSKRSVTSCLNHVMTQDKIALFD